MNDLNELAEVLQDLLGNTADRLASECGLIRRRRQLTGAKIAQALVFSHWAESAPTQGQIRDNAARLGADVSRQAITHRLDDQRTVDFLRRLLAAAVERVVTTPVVLPVLQRFTARTALDSSGVALPEVLVDLFRGGRSGHGRVEAAASVKLTVGLDLKSGRLLGPEVHAGRTGDLAVPLAQASPPKGGLQLADLNYFCTAKFARWDSDGAYWLSRIKCHTLIRDRDGTRWDLLDRLRRAEASDLDAEVLLGNKERLPCRLIARPVPPEVAQLRRDRLRAKAKDRGDAVSPLALALCNWTVVVTNVPVSLLSVGEAMALMRLRWQIELLFKLWKSGGGLGQWRGRKPAGLLCQLYSKLIMLVMRHWVLVATSWSRPDRSLTRAVQVVRAAVPDLVRSMRHPGRLSRVLRRIGREVQQVARMERRRRRPNAHEVLFCLVPGS